MTFDLMDSPVLFFVTLAVSAFAFVALLIGIISVPVYYLNKKTCFSMYQDYNPQFGFFENCRIEWKGKLTPVDMIKNININN